MEDLAEVIKDYLSRYPTIPSRRIARWISEKKGLDLENVRTAVRYHRGQQGIKSRVQNPEEKFFEQPYDLPTASTYDASDFVIPEKTVLILSDLQIPFHDIRAIKTAIDWAKSYSTKHHKIEAVLLNGDVLDCYQLSTFSRDPRERSIKEEIEDTKDVLQMLSEEFGSPIYFKFGNHEERYERYLYQHAKDLAGLSSLEEFFENDATIIKDKRIIKIGHLNIIHGHEFRGGISTPVNPARTYFLRAKAPTLGGDKHLTSEHSGRTIDGKLITCWSTGCLCDLKPKYMPLNEWNHGFALVRNEEDTFRVLNLRIENGVVY